jgi:hypothetical protein
MTVGDGADEALASRTAAIAAYHVGGDPGLVDEDETSWVQSPLAVAPSRAGRRHVRPVLLGGTKRLFLSRRPRRSSVRHRQPRLTVTRARLPANHAIPRASRRAPHPGASATPAHGPRACGAGVRTAKSLVDVRNADPQQRGNLSHRHATIHRRQNPRAQVVRIWYPHCGPLGPNQTETPGILNRKPL